MKQNDCVKRFLLIIGLGFLMVSAFVIRKHNFEVTPQHSIDEVIYFNMAYNIQYGLNHYNTLPLLELFKNTDRYVPPYFLNPLYKHPPVFTLLVSMSIRLFGFSELSAFYVPVLFSLMMIPLVYCLGALMFNRWVGFVSAILISLDPMSIVCSQKIWMESLIAFFTVFSMYAFVKALKTGTPRLFISSGILSGLGALTKYTGGIPTLIYFVYAGIFERKLFKDRYFLVSLVIPVIMLVPWLVWNISVYGWGEFIGIQGKIHSSTKHAPFLMRNVSVLLIIGVIFRSILNIKDDFPAVFRDSRYIRIFVGIMAGAVFYKSIMRSFQVMYLPLTGWSGKTFYFSTHAFYVEHLMEFSLIYFFGFLAFFIPRKSMDPEERLLRLGVIIVLVFFTIWGAYQSRYIIAINPLLILIATNFLFWVYTQVRTLKSNVLKTCCRSALYIIGILILAKLFFINHFVSFPNDFCYF